MQTPLNLLYLLMFMSAGCATANPVNDMPPIDPNSAIYEGDMAPPDPEPMNRP